MTVMIRLIPLNDTIQKIGNPFHAMVLETKE